MARDNELMRDANMAYESVRKVAGNGLVNQEGMGWHTKDADRLA